MNPLQLLLDCAADLLRLSEQVGEQPAQTIERLADQLGVNPAAALWLIAALSRLKVDRPFVFVAAVEHTSTSDSDSVIVAFTQEALHAALKEEQHIFLAGPDDMQITQDDLADDDRIITHYGEVYIR